MEWILVLAGGAIGAPVRYVIGEATAARGRSSFHWGTFIANTSASLILGFLAEAGTEGALGVSGQALLSTGFCGALSTWSTFSYEILTTAVDRRVAAAGGYLLITVVTGVAMSFIGAAISRSLW